MQKVWNVLSIVIITALVAGGVTYAYSSKKFSAELEAQQVQETINEETTETEESVEDTQVPVKEEATIDLRDVIFEPFEQESECTTSAGTPGFIMFDGKCYAQGEVVYDTGCKVSSEGTCTPYE